MLARIKSVDSAREVVKIAVKKRGREKRIMKGSVIAFTRRAIASADVVMCCRDGEECGGLVEKRGSLEMCSRSLL